MLLVSALMMGSLSLSDFLIVTKEIRAVLSAVQCHCCFNLAKAGEMSPSMCETETGFSSVLREEISGE